MSTLVCVRVKQGRLQAAAAGGKSGYNSLVTVRLNGVDHVTRVQAGLTPTWRQEFFFEANSPDDDLLFQIWHKGWFSKDLLGSATLSLQHVPFGEEVDSRWIRMWMDMGDGPQQTGHQLHVEVQFELPPGEDFELSKKLWYSKGMSSTVAIDGPNQEVDSEQSEASSENDESEEEEIESTSSESSWFEPVIDPHSLGDMAVSPAIPVPIGDSDLASMGSGTQSCHSAVEDAGEFENTSVSDIPASVPILIEHPPLSGDAADCSPMPRDRCRAVSAGCTSQHGMSPPDGGHSYADNDSIFLRSTESAHLSQSQESYDRVVVFNEEEDEKRRTTPHGKTDDVRLTGSPQAVAANSVQKTSSGEFFAPAEIKPSTMDRKTFVTKNENAQRAIKKRLALMSRRQVVLREEALKSHVYLKATQALMYPLSDNKEHQMQLVTFKKPAYCYECGGLLWGLKSQGMRCAECGVKCHKKCMELLNADCLLRAAERTAKQGDTDKTRGIKQMMRERMMERQEQHPEIFESIKEVFSASEDQHKHIMAESRASILGGVSKWSAKVKVTVVEAQGLSAKDKATGTSDPYVTVQVGTKKERTTTIPRELNPKWNETFDFVCHESSDRIKVRVWDEDDDLKSMIANKFIKEPDDFLGQTIIEIYSLSGEMDVWYTLDKRSNKSAVSGAIHLRINVEIDGEEKRAPFHLQYSCLHEMVFEYFDQRGDQESIVHFTETDGMYTFFPHPMDEIVEEFARRTSIENIYQIMTHFACLSFRYHLPGIPAALSKLLVFINGYFRDHVTTSQMSDGSVTSYKTSDRFSVSNFKRERFVEILDKLNELLTIDLSAYRDVFPAEQEDKLSDLKFVVDLLTSIMFFRQKVLGIGKEVKSKELVIDCLQASVQSTFCHLRGESIATVVQDDSTEPSDTPGPGAQSFLAAATRVTPLNYLHRLVELLAQMITQDRKVYSKYICQFRDLNVGDVSASTLWSLLISDMRELFQRPAVKAKCATADYMNLFFKAKWLFNKHVSKSVTNGADSLHELFSQHVRGWLDESRLQFESFLRNALEQDKENKFQEMSEHCRYSWSVVHIFSALTECHGVLQSIECTIPSLQNDYYHLYSDLVVCVLTNYTDAVHNILSDGCCKLQMGCVLLNNIEQLRLELEKLYKKMGGDQLEGTEAGDVLNRLQSDQLKQELDNSCVTFAQSQEPMVNQHIKAIPSKLAKLKRSAPMSEEEGAVLIDSSLEFLLKSVQTMFEICNKGVFKKVLKELYRIVLTAIRKFVVLPPLSRGHDDSTDLSPSQCAAIGSCLNALQDFFNCSGSGLRKTYMNDCAELKRLNVSLDMYTRSTDSLIGEFIHMEEEQDKLAVEEPFGELCLQVDIFAAQGEEKVIVKVVSASRLVWPTTVSGIFRPFVEITLLGPGLAGSRRRHETKSKTKNTPVYNELFTFPMNKMWDIQRYELHFAVRDYCFVRHKPLVGVTTLPLSRVQAAGTLAARLSLGKGLWVTDGGKDILCILAQRPHDEIAHEFVSLKLETRHTDVV